MTYVENPVPRAYRAAISAHLRSPSDAELKRALEHFVPAHFLFGELTFIRALRELLESDGLALTYCARKAGLEARRVAREPKVVI